MEEAKTAEGLGLSFWGLPRLGKAQRAPGRATDEGSSPQ